jgi:hypothetical protein
VSPVRYELSYYIAEEDIVHSHRRENLKYSIFRAFTWKTFVYEFHLRDNISGKMWSALLLEATLAFSVKH